MTVTSSDAVTLLDWKRQVFALYDRIRASDPPEEAWRDWVETRRDLYRSHSQSPIPEAERDRRSPDYFAYDESYRVTGTIHDTEPRSFEIPTSGTEGMRFTSFATCTFALGGHDLTLELYWLDAYAGGLFLPFRDATSGTITYGAGRYLLDTVKGSDLGLVDGELVLDFNFAYNPSCAYDPRWVCPLAPPPNRLDVAIEAGEKTPAS